MLGVPLFSPGGVLVRTHRRAIDKMNFPIKGPLRVSVHLKLLKDTFPEALFTPAVEAPVDCLPGTIAFR